jgi:hypothetical protein
MVARHMRGPHRFICVADSAKGFDKDVEVVITPKAAAKIGQHRSPEGSRFPSCYRRLWTFSKDATVLGDKVLLIDIDLIVTGDLAPLFSRPEEFVGWRPYRDWGTKLRFGGGIYLLKTGSRSHVWDDFQGSASIQRARSLGFRGSDQAWISHKLASTEKYFDRSSGIYSIRDLDRVNPKLPSDARIVQFNGPVKPWASEIPWVRENFR